VQQLERGRHQHDIVGIERNQSAARADAERTIVFDYDRFPRKTTRRPSHEWSVFDLREPFFENRRLGLPFVSELRVRPEEAVIGSAEPAQVLGHWKFSPRFDQPANRIDLGIGQTGSQTNATYPDAVTCGAFDPQVA